MLKLLLGQWQMQKKKSPTFLSTEDDIHSYEQPVNRFNPLYVESDEPISITSNGGEKPRLNFNEEVEDYNPPPSEHVQNENPNDSLFNERSESPTITTLNGHITEIQEEENVNEISTNKNIEQKPILKKNLGKFQYKEEQPNEVNEREVLKVLDRAISLSTVSSETDLCANEKNSETTNSSQNSSAIQRVSFQGDENNDCKIENITRSKKLEETEMPFSGNDTVETKSATSAETQPKSFLYSKSSSKYKNMESTVDQPEPESSTPDTKLSEKSSDKVDLVLPSSSKSFAKALNKKQAEGVSLKKVLKVRAKAIDELIKKFQGPDEVNELSKPVPDSGEKKRVTNRLQTIVKQSVVPEPIVLSPKTTLKQSAPPPPPPLPASSTIAPLSQPVPSTTTTSPLPVPSRTVQVSSTSHKAANKKDTVKVDTEIKQLQAADLKKKPQTTKLSSEISKETKSGGSPGGVVTDDKKSNRNMKTNQTYAKRQAPKISDDKVLDESKFDANTVSFETKQKRDKPLYEKANKQTKKLNDIKSANIEKRISKSAEISSVENVSISSGSTSDFKRNFPVDSLDKLQKESDPKVTKSDTSTLTTTKITSGSIDTKLGDANLAEEMPKTETSPKELFKKKANAVKNEIIKEQNKEKEDSGENSKVLSEDSGVTRGDQTSSESQASEKLAETKHDDTKKKSSLKVTSEVREIDKDKTIPRDRKRHSRSGHRRSCNNCKHNSKRDAAGLTNQTTDYYNKVTRDFPRLHNRRPESWASDMSWDEFVSREYSTSPKLKTKSHIRRPGSVRSSYHTRTRHVPRAYRNPYYPRHYRDFHRESDDSISSYPGVINDADAWQDCPCEDCWLSMLHRNFLERASMRCRSPVLNNDQCTCGVPHAFLHNGRKVKFVEHGDHHISKETELGRTEELPETDSESLLDSTLGNSVKDEEEPNHGKTGHEPIQVNKFGDFKKKGGSMRKDKKEEMANGNSIHENGHLKVNGLTNGDASKVLQPWEIEELDRMMRMRLLKKRRRRAQCMAVMALAMVVFVGLVVGIVMVYLRRKSL